MTLKPNDPYLVPMTLDELVEHLRPRFAQIAALELRHVKERVERLEQEAARDEG